MKNSIKRVAISFSIENDVLNGEIFFPKFNFCNYIHGFQPVKYAQVERAVETVVKSLKDDFTTIFIDFEDFRGGVKKMYFSKCRWKSVKPAIKSYLGETPQDKLKKEFLRHMWRQIQIAENFFDSSISCYKQEMEEEEISYEQYELLLDSANAELARQYTYLWNWCIARGLKEREFARMFPADM